MLVGSDSPFMVGGILTIAEDFLENNGQKFLGLMEELEERKMRQIDQDFEEEEEWDSMCEEEEEEYDEDDLSDEQRVEEGRRMFQLFAAKMFEQQVLAAYKEKV
jgi:hypothetical protein